MSHISHLDFDLAAAKQTRKKWSYRRLFVIVIGLSSLGWAAIIIACATLFR